MKRRALYPEFAAKLQRALILKGWTQSELARRAADYDTRKGSKIGRDSISHYIRGMNVPSPLVLEAIAKALGMKPQDLLPETTATVAEMENPPIDLRDLGNGNVWLRVNQAVEWPIALKIMGMLKGESARVGQ